MSKKIYELYNEKGEKVYPEFYYPIGTVIITSSNTNPSIYYGGTWELIDKEFKKSYGNFITTEASSQMILESTNVTILQSAFERSGHTVTIRALMQTLVDLNDGNITLFKLNLEKIGISSLGYALRVPLLSDGGNGLIMGSVNGDGTVTSTDVIMKNASGTLPIGAEPWFTFVKSIRSDYMLDEACDKFYWKRTG